MEESLVDKSISESAEEIFVRLGKPRTITVLVSVFLLVGLIKYVLITCAMLLPLCVFLFLTEETYIVFPDLVILLSYASIPLTVVSQWDLATRLREDTGNIM